MGSGRMLVATDVRLRRESGGKVVSTHPAAVYETFEPFTRVHDRVGVFAREAPPEAASVGRVDGPGVDVILVPNFASVRSLMSALPRTLLHAVREVGRHDVAFGRLPEPLSIVIGWLAVLRGRPFVANLVADPANPRLGRGRVRRQLDRLIFASVRGLVRRSAATVYVTESYLQQRCPPPPGNPTLVRSNVRISDDWFRPARTQGPGQAPSLILVGGNHSWGKGQLVLLDAVALLVAAGRDLRVSFVGGGPLVDDLEREAAARGLSSRVAVLGQVESSYRLGEVLDAHDVFCLPSLSEGLPRAMVEAMARGLPSVGSDVGGIPELLPPDAIAPAGDAGALADALVTVIDDPDPQARSQRAVDTARSVATKAHVDRLVDFLTRLERDRPARTRPNR